MMVSVALVLLMMLLFSQVFQTAAKSMTQQKGMAENDQKARLLTILMRGELAARTFQDVRPFRFQGTVPNTSVPRIEDRLGYFSISEGFPEVDTDDVLQFTIQVPVTELPISGAAVLLKNPLDVLNSDGTIDLGSTTTTTENIPLADYLAASPNQPEFDDGQLSVNSTGSSRAAELCYFLRNGNLYRRLLLIRDAYDDGGTGSSQPSQITGDYDSSVTANGSGHFWRDFFYSAFHKGRDGTGNSQGMAFHSVDSLSNASSVPVGAGTNYPISLGIPHLRFGSTLFLNDGQTVHPTGAPREWLYGPDNLPGLGSTDDDGNGTDDDVSETGYGNDEWIGRFTAHETADSDFAYPGRDPVAGNPMDPATNLALDPATGLVSAYSNEAFRRGEDIVLTNVHSFDIKVWDDDPAVKDWVDLGHSRVNSTTGNPAGHYNQANRRQNNFGNRYDTWHPGLGDAANPFPPYLPVDLGPNGVPGAPGDDDLAIGDTGGPDNTTEEGWYSPTISDDVVHPLRAIQITIRYYDLSSSQIRQVTLVHSLVNSVIP